jgi:Fe-S cluster biogenesis protein NfuA
MAGATFLYLPFLPHINTPALQSHNKPKLEVYDGHFLLKLHCCQLVIYLLLCQVLEEIRPYLVGAAGGSLELVAIEEPIVKVRLTGPAAGVMTVRVAVTQKLREKIPAIAAVQLL